MRNKKLVYEEINNLYNFSQIRPVFNYFYFSLDIGQPIYFSLIKTPYLLSYLISIIRGYKFLSLMDEYEKQR